MRSFQNLIIRPSRTCQFSTRTSTLFIIHGPIVQRAGNENITLTPGFSMITKTVTVFVLVEISPYETSYLCGPVEAFSSQYDISRSGPYL